jgi:acid stress-induced BolA-like protein IbaG/YrbA
MGGDYNELRPIQGYFSGMTPDEIKTILEAELSGCSATVISDDNTHFEAIVICEAFAGKRPLQRHQMVYSALGDKVGGDIHALSIKALTQEENASGEA